MFEKIIVASELSSEMDDVIRSLMDLKQFGAKECIVLQCIDPDQKLNQLKQLVTQVYKENLEREKTMLQEMGFIVTDRLVDGHLKKAIHQIAIEENCSLMVVGAQSISKIGDLLWGGAAHEVIHHMSKPVLQIRTGTDNQKSILDHILFSTDFSENAKSAYRVICEMAQYNLKKVTLVHVCASKDLKLHAEERLSLMAKELNDNGVNVISYKVFVGNPSKELLNVIKTDDISLVVMGSQGVGVIEDLFLGSISHNIARHSETSVLLVPY